MWDVDPSVVAGRDTANVFSSSSSSFDDDDGMPRDDGSCVTTTIDIDIDIGIGIVINSIMILLEAADREHGRCSRRIVARNTCTRQAFESPPPVKTRVTCDTSCPCAAHRYASGFGTTR